HLMAAWAAGRIGMQPALRDPNPPLTRSVEDYLKAIYHLSSQGGFAATSDIATMLHVSPPSVSGMVKRLSETGLIDHVPSRGGQPHRGSGARRARRRARRHEARAAAGGDAGCGASALLRRAGAHPGSPAQGERAPAVQRPHDHRAGALGGPARGGAGAGAALVV